MGVSSTGWHPDDVCIVKLGVNGCDDVGVRPVEVPSRFMLTSLENGVNPRPMEGVSKERPDPLDPGNMREFGR